MVKEMDTTGEKGTKELKLLFEEMDRVWPKMQGKGLYKVPKQETKIVTMYECWENDGMCIPEHFIPPVRSVGATI